MTPLGGKPRTLLETDGDHRVVVRDSEFLVGVLDKATLGNSSFGVIHCLFELYGPDVANSAIASLGRLLTAYLQISAVSCGVDDLCLSPAGDSGRTALVAKAYAEGAAAAATFAGLEDGGSGPDSSGAAGRAADPAVSNLTVLGRTLRGQTTDRVYVNAFRGTVLGDPLRMSNARELLRGRLRGGEARSLAGRMQVVGRLDTAVRGAVDGGHSEIISACLPNSLARLFPENFFSLMTETGAKGSRVNQAMIACGLGQQVLEGRRVPMMTSGRALPSFPPFDVHPRAGGYVADRFLTGLRPQEYYFHCMSGREGLVDTAVKTSRSGYLQRCLVKHLEDLVVGHDGTVRDSDGSVV